MSRAAIRGRLALGWWLHLLLALGPLALLMTWAAHREALPQLATPLFVAGLVSMFVTLPLFRRYKHALIATGKALDSPDEGGAWLVLARTRRLAAIGASLPAWIGALAVFTDLSGVALILLGLTSLIILCLYRIPRQLG
ncbi:MFS transporter [Pseudomonas panipatensis]|uniref:MFS transporter n=1 Tax=Pseudomonas panipatensis TaxID=428992 RepID=A0A1G8EJJ7_9PSED|nr:MFS transporter [Pseudomonas panipatensis]SDH69972.1 hypothetical protein SAMN05216272_102600 [Pseudomonas panipatensis]SMP68162.1 hypothetical protein SAMN06295951_108112 [Pseudomonas panipatensis]